MSDEKHDDGRYHGFFKDNIRQLAHDVDVDTGRKNRKGHDHETLSDKDNLAKQGLFDVTNPKLDPDSAEFDTTYWVKSVRHLFDSDPDYYRPSTMGVAYKDLNCYGMAAGSEFQEDLLTFIPKMITKMYRRVAPLPEKFRFDILHPMTAIMEPGLMTVVLGRPGSGCTTLLKTIAAQTFGFRVDKKLVITYDGLTPEDIQKHLRGNVLFSAETDVHFPKLTVKDTLEFVASMRVPKNRPEGVTRKEMASYMALVVMATFGLSHTKNTRVGDDFVRGVSGGERKRVSICEAVLTGGLVQCWDNATRGLDSATALEFVRAVGTGAKVLGTTPLIAIYQCSQEAYDEFDNAILLYEGRQIYFGLSKSAKGFFERQGWLCQNRQTTADFLTSLTNPKERTPRPGMEGKVPRTPDEFEKYWLESPEYQRLVQRVDNYVLLLSRDEAVERIGGAHNAQQLDHIKKQLPFTLNFQMQVKNLIKRDFIKIYRDPVIDLFGICAQVIMSLILSSIFYNMQQVTLSFYFRGLAIFSGLLFNAFSAILEIFPMFAARPVQNKQVSYGLYRPLAQAAALIVSSFPTRMLQLIGFNFIFYFMCNFRRLAGPFFFYWMVAFTATMVMSHIFRLIGAVANSLSQAMTPSAVFLMAMVIFSGFVITWPTMLGWSKWIYWINPIHYVFEAMMLNEFHKREFKCNQFIPTAGPYNDVGNDFRACSAVGSKPGSDIVQGTDFLRISYNFYNGHKWRNWLITVGFAVFFLVVYVLMTELNPGDRSKGEVAVFKRLAMKKIKQYQAQMDEEGGKASVSDQKEGSDGQYLLDSKEDTPHKVEIASDGFPEGEIFLWEDLVYSVKIKLEDRVILNDVDGWVKPGELTALMGASGAGKTTLLNCLSNRLTLGTVSNGHRMVNGRDLDLSFERLIGYVQQDDLHLPRLTVRESLQFSAYLRQPKLVPKKEKDAFVEEVIDILEMGLYADAMVGVAGSGLNVEQRKRLSIGVELAAKPKVLVFLDEPTSGLDSQTAWSICQLMRKLADRGNAILCTIHQPSAILMQSFDRLLFMQKGGETVYFGPLGKDCQTLVNYFESHGLQKCPPQANPADWMLEVVGAAPGLHANQNYYDVWRNLENYKDMKAEIASMKEVLPQRPADDLPDLKKFYAAPIYYQLYQVLNRTLVQDWRNPQYIYSKFFLVVSTNIFNGFAFFNYSKKNTQQSLQNQMFSIFVSYSTFATMLNQMFPSYVEQRLIYEVREAPSRTFSWFAFFTAQVLSELPFQFIVGTLAYFCYYYPVGFYRNAAWTHRKMVRGVLFWLLTTSFYLFSTTMGHLCISFMENDQNAANLASMLLTMCLMFCGVLAGPDVLPRFWIFMYRCNPLTYLIQATLAAGIMDAPMTCSDAELMQFKAPPGMTCGDYMKPFMEGSKGGYLKDESATDCLYCMLSHTNQYLATVNVNPNQRWWYFGIFWAFPIFNVFAGGLLYWLARVPKKLRSK